VAHTSTPSRRAQWNFRVAHPSRFCFRRRVGGLDAGCDKRSVGLLPRILIRRCKGFPPTPKKACTEPVRRNWYRFGPISGSLHQFCEAEQLFSPRLRATFERKPRYETVHTIVYPENLPAAEGPPVAGSQGLPREPAYRRQACPLRRAFLPRREGSKDVPCQPLPSRACGTGLARPFSFSLCAVNQNPIASQRNIKKRRK
jgi:hypothetical protein